MSCVEEALTAWVSVPGMCIQLCGQLGTVAVLQLFSFYVRTSSSRFESLQVSYAGQLLCLSLCVVHAK